MRTITSLVSWFCSQLTENELVEAIAILLEVLNGKRKDIALKQRFREEHPNYRQYDVDTTPPLTESPDEPPAVATMDWRELLSRHRADTGRDLQPVRRQAGRVAPPAGSRCEHCGAPSEWLYVNDGGKRTQLRCKVCKRLCPVRRIRHTVKGPFWCPHCGAAMYKWKGDANRTIYKCPNGKCPHFKAARARLNASEKLLAATGMGSQFKLHYQWRVYHFDPAAVRPEAPKSTKTSLMDVRQSMDGVGLALAYCVSLGMSARMTARALWEIHGVKVSHQTVINWMNAAAPLVWRTIRRRMDGAMAELAVAADETYIKVLGSWHYTWFVVGAESRAIWAWDVSDGRDMLPAVAVVNQTLDRRDPEIEGVLVLAGDGNPSYDAAVNAINSDAEGMPLPPDARKVERRTVVGLRNDDEESAAYRELKQIVERLNRTYRFHTRSRSGHKSLDGARALTTLFVAYYNFLRPHGSLDGGPPLRMPELDGVRTLQGRWLKLLELAA